MSTVSSPESTVALSPDQAAILLKADLRNLADKVRQGRTLSAAERNLLQSTLDGYPPSSVTFARNQPELADILGVSVRTIQRYRKVAGNPGARPNGSYEVQAWRLFIAQQRGVDDPDDLDQSKLRAQHILLQNQKLEFQLGILRRDFISASEAEQWSAELGDAIRRIVTTIHLVASKLVKLSVPDAEDRLKELEDDILQQLHDVGKADGGTQKKESEVSGP